MMGWTTLAMALREINRNKMRSSLTALGIIIGVGAVIAMVHLGQATTNDVTAQISSLGQNLLMVTPGTRTRGPGGTRTAATPFDAADVKALQEQLAGATLAPSAGSRQVVVYGNANWPTTVTGTDNNFFDVRDWDIAQGRKFEASELRSATPVCVLGKTVVTELFGDEDPLGAKIRVGKLSCNVIGVLQSKQAMMGSDQDDTILMPLRTFQRRIAGNWDVSMVYVSALEDGTTPQVKADIEGILRKSRRIAVGAADDFSIRDMAEIAKTVGNTTAILTILLGAIAGVSLLVGGIGIMNIMLVSVTERTREIGIRLSVGARGREVLLQFLVEAVVLSTIGGIVGIALGLGGSLLATQQLSLPFVLVPEIVTIAFIFSAAVGVGFGYWPARKAARLDPIEALRHE